jgi:hypothetical protein
MNVKNYGAVRGVAFLLKIIGGLTLAVGLLLLVVALQSRPEKPTHGSDLVAGLQLFWAIGLLVGSLFPFALGQLLEVFVDTAQMTRISASKLTFIAKHLSGDKADLLEEVESVK